MKVAEFIVYYHKILSNFCEILLNFIESHNLSFNSVKVKLSLLNFAKMTLKICLIFVEFC
jgi:hypothetical protein